MDFIYARQDLGTRLDSQRTMFLLSNGLGGYASATGAFSVTRCDHGILNAAVSAPNDRKTMVHRMKEMVMIDGVERLLSTQEFADGSPAEDGYRNLSVFSVHHQPKWLYQMSGVKVTRRCAMAWEKNQTAVVYTVENDSENPCALCLEPVFKFAPKEQALTEKKALALLDNKVVCEDQYLYIRTDGKLQKIPTRWELLSYPEDAKDGRPEKGYAAACCKIETTILPGCAKTVEVVFSMTPEACSGSEILEQDHQRFAQLEEACPLRDPVACQLAVAADAYIARRDSTKGKTILAGYPLFSDWGRDTMIALGGCCLSTGRYEDAKSILNTFLAYERNGLVPNLFPEGENAPMYNTVDAALLLIDGVWKYLQKTGDKDFAESAYPVMERMVQAYRNGTDHAIGMDDDGLIYAGSGLDQLTWMDVCVEGILPTPRHGKPVEVNAYWYNALCIMERLAHEFGYDSEDYRLLAQRVKKSFCEKFYMEDKGYLKDVLSGTKADEQLRCNQIWAVSMPFTMLSPEQEKRVVDTVFRHLYTPCGLRTLSPTDPEFKPLYGGSQMKRDLAYHQGTVWVYPMGAYYLAWLKTRGNTKEAAHAVKEQLAALEPMLREGCVGQLPEIYDGRNPVDGKGCFAQAWSVGEMLRVYEMVEKIEKGA